MNEEPARLAHMARYAVRSSVAQDRVHETDEGRVLLEIPRDRKNGDTVLSLDPLEWIHSVASADLLREGRPVDVLIGQRMTNQISDAGAHTVRYYGAYANRLRTAYRDDEREVAVRAADAGLASPSRASWGLLLHKVFEVDPLLCRCGAEMKVISVITAPGLVDRLLRHVREKNGADADTHGARDPPAA